MAPHEQIINVVASFDLRDDLGVNVGELYKMRVRNHDKDLEYFIRARIVHSFKAGPGFDILPGVHPIVPIMLYDAKLSQDFANKLLDEVIYVIGFFFPVVPR